MPSLGEHLQTQAKAFRLLLHMLAPIHLELELLHGPLCEVALERALAHIAHEQVELQRHGISKVANLQPQGPVHWAFRRSVLNLSLGLLAFAAAHALSPRLTWCEVQAHVWNLPYLQWWRNEREASTGLQLGKHMMDAPLDPLDEESAAAGAEGAGEGKAVGCGSPGGGRNGGKLRPGGGNSSMPAGQGNPGGEDSGKEFSSDSGA
eukprot:CAMPEP_0115389926 /NCGR_PEP_ID=MMETSP0271-20121206/9937_1 /TAXON_ID=71861 /ORGANISM="Scrippsiella trochoidea, Strain CCMP3099" /LENGTH=205 /DNA_ID=CAMNT_0002813451 /DNA_START=461 /DNA_END=1075 /DNA_ORIENTATION=-